MPHLALSYWTFIQWCTATILSLSIDIITEDWMYKNRKDMGAAAHCAMRKNKTMMTL